MRYRLGDKVPENRVLLEFRKYEEYQRSDAEGSSTALRIIKGCPNHEHGALYVQYVEELAHPYWIKPSRRALKQLEDQQAEAEALNKRRR